jgi:hypothetical protein
MRSINVVRRDIISCNAPFCKDMALEPALKEPNWFFNTSYDANSETGLIEK